MVQIPSPTVVTAKDRPDEPALIDQHFAQARVPLYKRANLVPIIRGAQANVLRGFPQTHGGIVIGDDDWLVDSQITMFLNPFFGGLRICESWAHVSLVDLQELVHMPQPGSYAGTVSHLASMQTAPALLPGYGPPTSARAPERTVSTWEKSSGLESGTLADRQRRSDKIYHVPLGGVKQ